MVERLDYYELISSLEKVFDKAIECKNDQRWEEFASEGSFTAYRMYVDGGDMAIKVQNFVDRPPKEFADYFFIEASLAGKKHTPDLIESSQIIRHFNAHEIIIHDKVLPQGPVSAREIYMFSSKAELSNGDWAIMTVSPEGIPTTPGYVQAHLNFSLYLFEKIANDPNRTNFTVINSIDPKGSIPKFIANSVASKRAYFFKILVDEYLATH
jgi:hypothetical protein